MDIEIVCMKKYTATIFGEVISANSLGDLMEALNG